MTEAADLILTNAEVYTLAESDGRSVEGGADGAYEAVAVRDGEIVRLGDAYEVGFLEGVGTRVVDLDGRIVLPGFVDSHTHMTVLGRSLVHADLSGATGPDDCVERLRERASELAGGTTPTDLPAGSDAGDRAAAAEWILGFGYDESEWSGDRRYLTRTDLDRVSETAPVAAVREDLHVGSLNSIALDRLRDEMPDGDVRRDGGEPTGVVVERALDAVYAAVEPDAAETRELLEAAQAYANERGVTGVHDMVRRSHAPAAYREMAAAGDLTLRVRLNYWADHLDALREVGLRTNHGDEMVRVGAIKTYTDGSIGARTAKVSAPYDDLDERNGSANEAASPGDEGGARTAEMTGEWVVPPADLDSLVGRAHGAGFQLAVHAIGDEAVDAAIDAFGGLEEAVDGADSGGQRDGGGQRDEGVEVRARRHRIEHAELASDRAIERMASLGVVASMQPNFHRWAGEGGLYDSRLGDRRQETNRLRDVRAAGVPLAFGSDCMPLSPLVGVHRAVNAPSAAQRLGVTAALRAYTAGAAYAGFDEDRLGTVAVGNCADLVALSRSPWESPDRIADIDVALTVVGGEIVHEAL